MYFEKPPLIELIAELRWLPAGVPAGSENALQQQMPAALFAGLGRSSEQLYMRFAGLMGARGFLHSERLIPVGFPTLPFQPVYRYSKAGTKPGEPVFQLGGGVFTAHVTPPYKSWMIFAHSSRSLSQRFWRHAMALKAICRSQCDSSLSRLFYR